MIKSVLKGVHQGVINSSKNFFHLESCAVSIRGAFAWGQGEGAENVA